MEMKEEKEKLATFFSIFFITYTNLPCLRFGNYEQFAYCKSSFIIARTYIEY